MLIEDPGRCYRAVQARDARFDGVFYTAVRTTGIYCRPSCPAVTPKSTNVTFYVTAAAAHEAGYRACRRCRPDATPGSPEWNVRADAVGRAMRMIRDGVVEHDGVAGIASRLGYTERHVSRLLRQELGAGPLSIARSERARTARVLIETTEMPLSDVAFASGFASIRQFNDTMRQVYDTTPTTMRTSHRGARSATGRLELRLAVRQPFDGVGLLSFLEDHAVPGLESVTGSTYARVLTLRHGWAIAALAIDDTRVVCKLSVQDARDTMPAVQRCRALLDLDADPVAIDRALGADPLLGPLVDEVPGMRLPGAVGGFELVIRTIVGQQVSVPGARTVQGRIVERFGEPIESEAAAAHGLTHAFPAPEVLASLDAAELAMPRQRGRAVIAVAQAVVAGRLELQPGADRDELRRQLLVLPGVGPWTADYVAMRASSDPDVFIGGDLIVRRALETIGADSGDTDAWRPWRSYAVMHLWREARRREVTQKTMALGGPR